MSPIELNAIIQRLIETDGHDEEARNALVEATAKMQSNSPVMFYKKTTTHSPGGQMTGHTELGQDITVGLNNREADTQEVNWGDKSIRVGHYKLSCDKNHAGKISSITIQYFWKADVTTQSETETAEEWRMDFDQKGELDYFAKISEPVKVLRIPWVCTIFQTYAVVTWSRDGKLGNRPQGKLIKLEF